AAPAASRTENPHRPGQVVGRIPVIERGPVRRIRHLDSHDEMSLTHQTSPPAISTGREDTDHRPPCTVDLARAKAAAPYLAAGPMVQIRLPPAERCYGTGDEKMATSSLQLTDGVPRCPSRTT